MSCVKPARDDRVRRQRPADATTLRDLAEQLPVDVSLTEDRTHFKHVASYRPGGRVAPG